MPETSAPPVPRLSSTLLMLRAGTGAPEVLMVKRHYEIDFAAGALVFPGGKATEGDSDPGWDGSVDGDPGDGVQRAAKIAAVREAFEEAGLLFARPEAARGPGRPLVSADVAQRLAPCREPLDRGEMSFLALLREHGLVLALDRLIHFGHWITPVIMPKRFDTHFYLAVAPEGQAAGHDGRETTDAVWLTAAAALAEEAAGRATVIFPTRMNLVKLAAAASLADAEERFSGAPVVTVLPQPGRSPDGQPCLYIPAEAGYGHTMELLSNVKV